MNTLSGQILKIIEELTTEIKQPWQMTLDEFQRDPYEGIVAGKTGYVVAYHRITDEKNLPSILQNGLDPNKRSKYSEGPTMMASSKPEGYSEYGTLIVFRTPEDTPKTRVSSDEDYYFIYKLIPPEDILFVDQVADLDIIPNSRRVSWARRSDYFRDYWMAFVEKAIEEGKPVDERIRNEYEEERSRGERRGKRK